VVFLYWLALAMRSKYLGAGSHRLARGNVLIEFNFNSTVRRSVQRDVDMAGLLSFCRECGPIKIIVLFAREMSTS
jgi:hypothetical protein